MRNFTFRAFDTQVELKLWGTERGSIAAAKHAKDMCRRCESLFSRTIPTSDVGRINSSGGEWVSVSPETLDILEVSLEYCRQSKGAFDITIGPVVAEWNFKQGTIPSQEKLDDAIRHVGVDLIQVSKDDCRVRLADPDAMIDLGGIAKGWIADRIKEELADDDFQISGMIANLGGNIVVEGNKPGLSSWLIGVKNPWDSSRNVAVMRLASGSIVTSGTYERSFEREGTLYHHILDPRTGWPVDTDLASASLVCERSIDAEGYSTTVLALGKEAGSRFVRERPEIMHACLVGNDGELLLM